MVVGTVKAEATGKSDLSKEQIDTLPVADTNIEALIKLMPGVQISDKANTSFRGGEISPPLISISGGRPYDNNFLIDGMSNNSLLDPGSDIAANSPGDVPGHPQEIFLSTHLVANLEVYNNNIPARFGDFAGGVVNVETIDPTSAFEGSIRYRTTRASWTEFHIDQSDQLAFTNSFTETKQPRFEKQDVGFDLSLPVTEKIGFLISYSLLYSEIPLQHFGQTENQTRSSENVLVKYVNKLSENRKLTVQGLYNPYEGEYFIDRTKDSRFTLQGGGSQVGVEYEHLFSEGHLLINSGLSFSENSRKAPQHHRNWDNTASKLSLIHISEPTRPPVASRMPSSA